MKIIYIVYNVDDVVATKQMFFKLQLALDYYNKMKKKHPKGNWKFTHKEVF